MRLATKCGHLLDKILDILASGAGLLLGLIAIITLAEIIMRYFLNRPFDWGSEVTEYSMLWMAFLATAWVLKNEKHVVTDLVMGRVSPRSQRILNIFTSSIATCGCLIFTFYSFKVTIDLFNQGLQLPSVIKPLAFIVYLVIPLGGLLLTIQFIRRTVKFATKAKSNRSEVPAPEEAQPY
jgi:TRAP-type C4-dicarboxylate transport system permease small subunit